MQKLSLEKQNNEQKASNLIIWLLLILVAFISGARIIVANQLVGTSEKLHNLDQQISQIALENQILAENLRAAESLIKLESTALSHGFVKSDNFAYLPKENPVALTKEAPNL